jgi:hypothetical protein
MGRGYLWAAHAPVPGHGPERVEETDVARFKELCMGTARSGVELGRFPKTVKNRIHWDVYGDMDAFVAAGATMLADLPAWTVLADPEGNESCVFPDAG